MTFHITPLKEGTIEVVGVMYTLTVQDAQLPGDPPTPAGTRTILPSLNATAKDSIYERSMGASVQSVLSEGIQGKVMFAVRGQRLNTSKMERCATMYGPDYRLKWTVAEPQPKIVVSPCVCVCACVCMCVMCDVCVHVYFVCDVCVMCICVVCICVCVWGVMIYTRVCMLYVCVCVALCMY